MKEIQGNPDEISGGSRLPTMEDFVRMRPIKGEHNGDGFVFVNNHLCRAVIGKRLWDDIKFHKPLSKILTISDEAFLYTILENSYELWVESTSRKVEKGTYTKQGTNKKYCGWSSGGINKYNDFFEKVKENREEAERHGNELEMKLLEELKARFSNEHTLGQASKRRRKRRRELGDESEEESNSGMVEAYNTLDEM